MSVFHANNETFLVGGSRSGQIYSMDITNMPEPLFDADTDMLYEARVIGALPMAYPRAANLGGSDLIIGGENGLHYTTVLPGQNATFKLRYAGEVLQRGATLVTGQTPTVSVADFDHDGFKDLIAGTSEGRILFAKGSPAGLGFGNPIPIRVGEGEDQAEILVQGGYRIDIQGPEENRWGYTAPCAVDWNGDGLIDLVSSDNSALTKIYLRYRTGNGTLALHRGVPLKLDGLELHGTWRNGPAAMQVAFDSRTGHMLTIRSRIGAHKMALVTSDEQDEVHLYWRLGSHHLEDGGKLMYRDKSCNTSNCLLSIQTNYLHAGGTGRLKYSLVDFDGDGLVDLLLGTCGYHAIPNPLEGLPACSPGSGQCSNRGATALLMRQTNKTIAGIGTSPGPVFEFPEWITVKGSRISYGGQELGIAPLSINGEISLILATPGGRHVYWAADDIGTSASEPPLSRV